MQLDPFRRLFDTVPAARWQALLDAGDHVQHDDGLGLWIVVGDANVEQAFRDTVTFADVTTMVQVEPITSHAAPLGCVDVPMLGEPGDTLGNPPSHARAQAALQRVWPGTLAQAHTRWGRRVAAQIARQLQQVTDLPGTAACDTGFTDRLAATIGSLLPLAVVSDLLGIPADDARRLAAHCDAHPDHGWTPPMGAAAVRAAEPLALLRRYSHALVRQRAADRPDPYNPPQPDSVLDDLLVFRHGPNDPLTLHNVAALTSALFAATLDTASRLLPRVVGAAIDAGTADPRAWTSLATQEHHRSRTIHEALDRDTWIAGWLRCTTQTVLLDRVRIPGDAVCLLLAGTADHPGHPVRPELDAQLRFVADATDGAGTIAARLVADLLLADLACRHPDLPATCPQLSQHLGALVNAPV